MWFPANITSSCIWVAILLTELFYIGMPVARTDGQAGGRMVTWLPNFLGWVDYFIFLPMVLRCARLASEISAKNLCFNNFVISQTTRENSRFLMGQLHLMLLNWLFGNFSPRQTQVSCMFWTPLQNLPYLSPRVCTGGRSNAYVITIFFRIDGFPMTPMHVSVKRANSSNSHCRIVKFCMNESPRQ